MEAGCKLVSGDCPSRWNREQIETVFSSLPVDVISKVGKAKDRLLHFSALSGTPGFLTFSAYGERIDPKQATMLDLEWRRGVKALYEPSLELEPGVTSEGRFPDRNGIFHHSEVHRLAVEEL